MKGCDTTGGGGGGGSEDSTGSQAFLSPTQPGVHLSQQLSGYTHRPFKIGGRSRPRERPPGHLPPRRRCLCHSGTIRSAQGLIRSLVDVWNPENPRWKFALLLLLLPPPARKRKMHFSERRFFTHMSRFLALGFLMLFATAVLRYTSWECEFAHLGEDSGDPRSRSCKDQLYQSVSLSLPQGGLNCSRITRGDPEAVEEALLSRLRRGNKREPLKENDYLNMTQDCVLFKGSRKFIQVPLSREEEGFPIAYSMVVHEKVEMFERLLRAIYAPQNVYCVHVDKKSPKAFQEAVRAIASCFDNVFLASRQETVVYASWSRVQADLNCMEDLLRSSVPWRYLLNTCGTDFPIKTNAEIVRSLKFLNGRNNMESEKPSTGKQGRWKYHHDVKDTVIRTDKEKSPPPHSSPMFTGNAYVVVTREFVQHLFGDPTVKKLLEWCKDTYSPDEHLWATLHRMPGMPGSVPFNAKFDLTDMNAIARLVKWAYSEGDIGKGAPYPPCTGVSQRAVCVYGVGDLRWMFEQHHLFANKFDPQVDNNAIQCLEEYLRHKAVYGTGL